MSIQQWPLPSILALYRLPDVNDSSGNSHTLTNNNSVAFGIGKLGNCAQFGAANSNKYLSHDDAFGKDLSGDASISLWVMLLAQPATNDSFHFVRWGSTTGTSRAFGLYYSDTSGVNSLDFSTSGGTIIHYNVTLELNKWYKVDVNISGTCELFLNGAPIGSKARGTTTTPTAAVMLGASVTPSRYVCGNIDEAIFFNATRTAQLIRRRYAFERGMLC